MAATVSSSAGTLARTRRAILDAAIEVFARDTAAAMGEIARAAEVGRSTLHRYFPDRSALVRALQVDCAEAAQRLLTEARLDDGPVNEAFRRLVRAMFELGPRINFLFSEVNSADWDDAAWEQAHIPIARLFQRGQQECYFDCELELDWFIRTLWYLISAGWESMDEDGVPRYIALDRVIRTLENGVREPRD
ncbi:helix-turn-helix domain-containing protein [Streptomyces sp. DSM 44915]|uniref:Helix-turn-helix domain-containing protein n=1 Tax=Streptomyces chisholmiae TaxID=3075540 RepID=A0ABU2JKD0_9ACTN|nr:helix-turn-helix domain-containing protein [Streptomyces sp. DSM 44915]MDT0265372.1 helix-turn-helix domain-containing protein [Streptomyces sp. DSM 44915]